MGMRSYARFEEVADRAGDLASVAPGDLPRIADMRVPMRQNHAKSTCGNLWPWASCASIGKSARQAIACSPPDALLETESLRTSGTSSPEIIPAQIDARSYRDLRTSRGCV